MSTVTYTREDVEDALCAILGDKLYLLSVEDDNRHLARDMERAAVKCWLESRPEDRHSEVLRASLTHLNKTGVLMPEDRRPQIKGH